MKWSLGLIMAGVVVISQATAAWQPVLENQSSPIKITKRTLGKSSLLLTFELPGFDGQEIATDGIVSQRFTIPGSKTWRLKGFPELPKIRENLAIPYGALVNYRIVNIEQERLKVGVPYPSKGSFSRQIDPSTVKAVRGDVYFQNTVWPAKAFTLGKKFQMRKLSGIPFIFNPIQYQTETEELIVTKSITVQIKFKGSKNFIKGENKEDSAFLELYKNRFFNYSQVKKAQGKYKFIEEKGKIAYITPKKWVDEIQPLVDWKAQIGFDVEVVTLEDLSGSDDIEYTHIKDFIQKGYDERDFTYVVLIGDSEDMPFHPGESGNAYKREADPMYALVDGKDSYPDLFVSRISGQTDDDINNIVARTINYEKNPDVNGDWYAKAIGVASEETYYLDPNGLTDWERADLLKDMLLDWGYTQVDGFYEPDTDNKYDLADAINEGRGFINYIGHGSTTAWSTTRFNTRDIKKLKNGSMLPFIVSVACINGEFAGEDSFAEAWLTAGSVSNPKGAIAIFASSTNQAWIEPTIGQKEITTLLTQEKATTIGGLFFNGVMATLDDDDKYAVQTYETWHIFGDASLQVRTKKPTLIDAILPRYISAFTHNISFNVQEPGISVGVLQNGKLIGKAISDAQGELSVDLKTKTIDRASLTMTFTGFNKIPLTKKILVRSNVKK